MNLPNQSMPVRRQNMLLSTSSEGVNPSMCVSGTVNGNQACVDIPVLGKHCLTLPITAPVGASVSACTCGSIIPTGAKIKVSAAGVTLYSTSIGFGC